MGAILLFAFQGRSLLDLRNVVNNLLNKAPTRTMSSTTSHAGTAATVMR